MRAGTGLYSVTCGGGYVVTGGVICTGGSPGSIESSDLATDGDLGFERIVEESDGDVDVGRRKRCIGSLGREEEVGGMAGQPPPLPFNRPTTSTYTPLPCTDLKPL